MFLGKDKLVIENCTSKSDIIKIIKYLKKMIYNYYDINKINWDIFDDKDEFNHFIEIRTMNSSCLCDHRTAVIVFESMFNLRTFDNNKVADYIFKNMRKKLYQITNDELQTIDDKTYLQTGELELAHQDLKYQLFFNNINNERILLCTSDNKYSMQKLFNQPWLIHHLVDAAQEKLNGSTKSLLEILNDYRFYYFKILIHVNNE